MYVTRDNFSHNFVAATVCYSRRFFIATCKIRATILQFFELQHVAATKCCVKSHPVRHAIVSCNIIYKWTLYSQWTFLLIFNIFCPGYGSSICITYRHYLNILLNCFHLCFIRRIYRAVFTLVTKVYRVLFGFISRFYFCSIGLKKLALLFHSIRSKTKMNHNSLALDFPRRFAWATYICFEFWLVHCIVRVLCYWLEW